MCAHSGAAELAESNRFHPKVLPEPGLRACVYRQNGGPCVGFRLGATRSPMHHRCRRSLLVQSGWEKCADRYKNRKKTAKSQESHLPGGQQPSRQASVTAASMLAALEVVACGGTSCGEWFNPSKPCPRCGQRAEAAENRFFGRPANDDPDLQGVAPIRQTNRIGKQFVAVVPPEQYIEECVWSRGLLSACKGQNLQKDIPLKNIAHGNIDKAAGVSRELYSDGAGGPKHIVDCLRMGPVRRLRAWRSKKPLLWPSSSGRLESFSAMCLEPKRFPRQKRLRRRLAFAKSEIQYIIGSRTCSIASAVPKLRDVQSSSRRGMVTCGAHLASSFSLTHAYKLPWRSRISPSTMSILGRSSCKVPRQ